MPQPKPLDHPIPAVHTVYTGPRNQHGMKVNGHVLARRPRTRKVLFTDNKRTTQWVLESTVAYPGG